MKKRIIGLDILRVLGIIFIFCYHFTDSYIALGNTGASVFNTLSFFSLMSRPASLLLFIISGFALMYNSEDKLSLKDYFKRRFKGLYIPFYVAYIMMLGIGVVLLHWAPWQSVANRTFIFTILGVDGLAANYAPNFYLVGEWFMSCIVVCYVLFPLLAACYRRFKYITLAVLLVLYVVLAQVTNPFPMAVFVNPLFILTYFYLGMILQEKLAEGKTPKWLKLVCIIISILIMIYAIIEYFFTADRLLNLSETGSELMCVIWSVALIIALRDVVISEGSFMLKVIKYISGISWYFILVHHVLAIIYFNIRGISSFVLFDFLIILILSIILATIVKKLSQLIWKLLRL